MQKMHNPFASKKRFRKYLPLCGGLAALLILSGCLPVLQSTYTAPEMQMPAAWQYQGQSQDEQGAKPEQRWWLAFNDPVLNALMDEALAGNSDLKTAALNTRKALLEAGLARSDQFPELSGSGGGSAKRSLRNWDDGSTQNYSGSVALSYELDLWNRLGNTTKAARLEARAVDNDGLATMLSLTGTLAADYYEIGYLQERIRLSLASIDYAKKSLELVQVQKDAGAATSLEILEAQQSLASQEASHAALQQQLVEAQNALALLFDGPPENGITADGLLSGKTDFNTLPVPGVSAGLPATLLARRPDMRAAELRMREALVETDIARADMYPSFSLTSSLGLSSDALADFFSNPFASLAASISLPFLQWNDVQRNIGISEIAYEQTVIAYRQALYTALSEVENSLSARRQYLLQEEKLQLALDLARKTEAVYYIRYKEGNSALKDWLDAQESRRQAEVSLAENRLNQLQNYVTLCKALGGGLGDPDTGNDEAAPL